MSVRTAVVLLDYDQSSVTRRCLRSIAAGARPDEVVLVENGGPPVDLAGLSDEALNLRVLRLEVNRGPAAARNLAFNYLAQNSDVSRYVLLDNDTTVGPEFFERVADADLDELEIAAPLILSMETGEVIYAGGRFDEHLQPSVVPNWPEGEIGHRGVPWAPTAGLVFDRPTWLRVGGFNEWYGFSWEDIEWCWRAAELGATIRVWPELRVMHEAHQSTGGPFSHERIRQWSRNGTVFLFEDARVSRVSRAVWLRDELIRTGRELRAGWRDAAAGRLRGLGEGLREVWRRRAARSRGSGRRAAEEL